MTQKTQAQNRTGDFVSDLASRCNPIARPEPSGVRVSAFLGILHISGPVFSGPMAMVLGLGSLRFPLIAPVGSIPAWSTGT